MLEIIAIGGSLLAVLFIVLWARERRQRIANLKQMGIRLKKHKSRLRKERDHLLDALNDAFLLVDPSGRILFANEPTTELVAGRLVKDRHLKEVFLDERITRAMEKALTTGRGVSEQIVLPPHAAPGGVADQRGETAWIIDAAPLDRNTEKPITRIVIRDITAEHQAEQVRKDFVANASHELRTPLSIINGYLENMVEGEIEDPEFRQRSLLVMQKHGKRIARIVEDMLVISRLESGEAATINPAPFKFQNCAQDVVNRLEALISRQEASVQFAIPDPTLTLIGDRFYWTQVFFNLVENALKQNPKQSLQLEIGGKVNADEGGDISLWVKDDGVGIPSNDLPFVFKRFYRVEKHHNQDSIKGTGLGLSIVKRAVEAHRGQISVSSVPGQHTTFAITLPPELAVGPDKN